MKRGRVGKYFELPKTIAVEIERRSTRDSVPEWQVVADAILVSGPLFTARKPKWDPCVLEPKK